MNPADNQTVMKYPIAFLFVLLSLTGLSPLIAEEDLLAAGHITYAQGEGFEIIRQGKKRILDPAIEVLEGTEIRAGDFINTYNNTFLELLLEPGDRVIKISEHTSFSVPESVAGDISIDLSYGRVRARVKKMAQGRSFTIRGMSTAAGVRGTDFGFDIIAQPMMESSELDDSLELGNSLIEASVYCFEGSLEVRNMVDEGEEELEKPTIVSAGEMLVRTTSDTSVTFSTKPIKEEIKSFWQINEFVTHLAEEKEVDEPTAEADPAALAEAAKKYRKAAIATGITGALLSASGAIIAFADPISSGIDGREGLATGLAISGTIFLATSLLSYILSF